MNYQKKERYLWNKCESYAQPAAISKNKRKGKNQYKGAKKQKNHTTARQHQLLQDKKNFSFK